MYMFDQRKMHKIWMSNRDGSYGIEEATLDASSLVVSTLTRSSGSLESQAVSAPCPRPVWRCGGSNLRTSLQNKCCALNYE